MFWIEALLVSPGALVTDMLPSSLEGWTEEGVPKLHGPLTFSGLYDI